MAYGEVTVLNSSHHKYAHSEYHRKKMSPRMTVAISGFKSARILRFFYVRDD